MAQPPAVEVTRLRKRFRRGERHDSLRDLVPALLRRGGRPAPNLLGANEFWALDDVSFAVRPGEAVGVIGPNGAGKSTMLKLLTKILYPTSGRCEVRGRVGALIELAAGFHQDLTGRENIFLQGAIMGMRRQEIDAAIERIVEFAGVEEFIDTPVKRYSSGMNARLGFSIAAHLEPDVLIIDEVLSVGDLAFQERCVQRMKAFKDQGVAIVFVSHNMQAISNLCDRAIYLQRTMRAEGPASEVIATYLRATDVRRDAGQAGEAEIVRARLTDPEGLPVTNVAPGAPLRLEVEYVAHQRIAQATFGFLVHRSTDGLLVYDGNIRGDEVGMPSIEAGTRFTLRFDFHAHFTRGQYHLECHLFDGRINRHVARLRPAGVLSVTESRSWAGVADVALECVRLGAGA